MLKAATTLPRGKMMAKRKQYERKTGFARRLTKKLFSNSEDTAVLRKKGDSKWRPRKGNFRKLLRDEDPETFDFGTIPHASSMESDSGDYKNNAMTDKKKYVGKKQNEVNRHHHKQHGQHVGGNAVDTDRFSSYPTGTVMVAKKKSKKSLPSSSSRDDDSFAALAESNNAAFDFNKVSQVESFDDTSSKRSNPYALSVQSDPTNLFSKEEAFPERDGAPKLTAAMLASHDETTFTSGFASAAAPSATSSQPLLDHHGIENVNPRRKFYQFTIDEDKESTVIPPVGRVDDGSTSQPSLRDDETAYSNRSYGSKSMGSRSYGSRSHSSGSRNSNSKRNNSRGQTNNGSHHETISNSQRGSSIERGRGRQQVRTPVKKESITQPFKLQQNPNDARSRSLSRSRSQSRARSSSRTRSSSQTRGRSNSRPRSNHHARSHSQPRAQTQAQFNSNHQYDDAGDFMSPMKTTAFRSQRSMRSVHSNGMDSSSQTNHPPLPRHEQPRMTTGRKLMEMKPKFGSPPPRPQMRRANSHSQEAPTMLQSRHQYSPHQQHQSQQQSQQQQRQPVTHHHVQPPSPEMDDDFAAFDDENAGTDFDGFPETPPRNHSSSFRRAQTQPRQMFHGRSPLSPMNRMELPSSASKIDSMKPSKLFPPHFMADTWADSNFEQENGVANGHQNQDQQNRQQQQPQYSQYNNQPHQHNQPQQPQKDQAFGMVRRLGVENENVAPGAYGSGYNHGRSASPAARQLFSSNSSRQLTLTTASSPGPSAALVAQAAATAAGPEQDDNQNGTWASDFAPRINLTRSEDSETANLDVQNKMNGDTSSDVGSSTSIGNFAVRGIRRGGASSIGSYSKGSSLSSHRDIHYVSSASISETSSAAHSLGAKSRSNISHTSQNKKPTGLPSNAIMASMLFRMNHNVDTKAVEAKLKEKEAEGKTLGDVPTSINASSEDCFSCVSAFSEETYGSTLLDAWKKPSNNLLDHFATMKKAAPNARRPPRGAFKRAGSSRQRANAEPTTLYEA